MTPVPHGTIVVWCYDEITWFSGLPEAERNAWLGLFTVRSESSDHRHKLFEVDQKPCRTSMWRCLFHRPRTPS